MQKESIQNPELSVLSLYWGTGPSKCFNINKLSQIFGLKIALEALFWGSKIMSKDNYFRIS